MDWYEQIDAPVAHIPAALVIDKSTYLSLLLDAFHGIHPSDTSLVGSVVWHWEKSIDADVRLLLTFSASFVKNLKYPFDLRKLNPDQRVSRFQQLLITPLRLAWASLRPDHSGSIRDAWLREKDAPIPHAIPAQSYQLWTDSFCETPAQPESIVSPDQETRELEKSFVAPSPTKPTTKSQPLERAPAAYSRPGGSSAQSSPSTVPQYLSLQYDVSGSDTFDHAVDVTQHQTKKRKSPDSEQKAKQKTKQRKFEFL